MINTKSKGSKAERELIHKLWEKGWAALRSAGSGCTKYPSPDIIASNNIRKIAIEVKSIKNKAIYVDKKQIIELQEFSKMFGCEPYLGVKFTNKKWCFLSVEDLKETKNNYCANFDNHSKIGFSFPELIGEWEKNLEC